jgi:amidohydrolase
MMDPSGPDLPDLVALRHRLHRSPELSGREEATARTMARFFSQCGARPVATDLAGHGVAAVFSGPGPGPRTLLRAELDALPITEPGDFPHASDHPGVAHKCGHDGHLAILAGVARRLSHRPLQRGQVMLLCQPAEETGQGAAALAAHPRIREFTPDRIYALHNLPGYPAGQILVRPGPFAAGSAGLTVRLEGRTSHAAYPEQGLSPDRALADLVSGLVALPIPLEKEGRLALVTVAHARLGEAAFGITPGQAEILATVRADDDATLLTLKQGAEALAGQVAAKYGLGLSCSWSEEFPVTWNDPAAAADIARMAAALGLDCAEPQESPFRWSEDFGHLLQLGPGAMFGLGAGQSSPPLHAGDYDFNDDLIPLGVAMMEQLARR